MGHLAEKPRDKLVRTRGLYIPALKLRGREVPGVERDDVTRPDVDRGRQDVTIAEIRERRVFNSAFVACDLSSGKHLVH